MECEPDIALDVPIGVNVIICTVLLAFSGTMAGLTLALLTLDVTELELLIKTRAKNWKEARRILPLRKRGNILLSTLLLMNVAVNSLLSILLAELMHGLTAFIISTILIMIFAEIFPQAVFARYSLIIGSKLINLVWVLVAISSPVTVPLGLLLDCLLGRDVGKVYTRDDLKALIEMQGALHEHDRRIIGGALDFSLKTASHVMLPIEHVFCVGAHERLTPELLQRMHESGFSRIPVYDRPNHLVGVLRVRDLYLLDISQQPTAELLVQYYNHELIRVTPDVTLEKLLAEFKTGRCHLAVVSRSLTNRDAEDLGIITMEDVIEELIGDEIIDESDLVHDTPHSAAAAAVSPRSASPSQSSAGAVGGRAAGGLGHSRYASDSVTHLDESGTERLLRELRASVDAFSMEKLSDTVLRKLLSLSPVMRFRPPAADAPRRRKRFLYVRGKPDRYFTAVLEGQVMIDSENGVTRLAGSGTFLGEQALEESGQSWSPDFSACITFETEVSVLRISRETYHAALSAARVERRGRREHVDVALRQLAEMAASGGRFPKAKSGAYRFLHRNERGAAGDAGGGSTGVLRVHPRAPAMSTDELAERRKERKRAQEAKRRAFTKHEAAMAKKDLGDSDVADDDDHMRDEGPLLANRTTARGRVRKRA